MQKRSLDRRRTLAVLLTVGLLLALTAFLVARDIREIKEEAESRRTLTVWVATDLHYIAPELTENSEIFAQLTAEGDGKQLVYIDAIVRAFFDEVKAARPDVLILSGDLTCNGEDLSHQHIAGMLSEVEAAGVQVLVTPGNHDLNYYEAFSYADDAPRYWNNTTREQFAAYYLDFGRGEAGSRDSASMSYTAECGGVTFAVLDDAVTASGTLLPETYAWLEKQLAKAQKAGRTVIGVSHHNLLSHSLRFSYGYTIYRGDQLEALYREYGVRLHLSGHLHIQSIAEDDGIYDIAGGSLAVYPFHYGVMTVTPGGEAEYRVACVDVQGWAEKTGQTDPNLLDFAAYSYEYMTTQGRDKTLGDDAPADLTPEERAQMLSAMVRINTAYYAGEVDAVRDSVLAGPGWALWQTRGAGMKKYAYLLSMLADDGVPDTSLDLSLG